MYKKGIILVLICFLFLGSVLTNAQMSRNSTHNILIDSLTTDTITLNPSDDATIRQAKPTTNQNDGDLKVRNRFGAGSDDNWAINALIKFNLNSMPENSEIFSATLNLYYYEYHDNNPVGRPLSLYSLTSNWDENTVTWNTKPSYSASIIDTDTVPSNYGWMSFDVTDSVQNIVSGYQNNYGWQIMDETPWNNYDIPKTLFRSKDSGINIPVLEINYEANEPPISDADGPYNANVDQIITFDGSGSYDPDGTITEYIWNFGDGYTGQGIAPTHTYTTPGYYTVTLTVKDNDGDSDIDSTTANINSPPTAHINGPYTAQIDETIILDGSNSSDSDGTIVSYDWDLDNDGQYDDATGTTPGYKWTRKGEYIISLKVIDDDQSFDTDSTLVTIINNPPGIPSTPEGPDEGKIREEHSYTTTTNEPDGHQIYYKWSWGDGIESDWLGPYENGELCTASHNWNSEDDYEIKVKAKDNYDEESDWSDPISVTMPHQKNIERPIIYLIKWILNQIHFSFIS